MLLDESFSQLDHTTSRILREDFVGLVREFKKTCLLITHRIDDAIEMADRIVVLAAPAKIKLELMIDRKMSTLNRLRVCAIRLPLRLRTDLIPIRRCTWSECVCCF